ncbi:MAG: HIT domain-containing protein, partial [Deltaproteobacteria bacterium]|nr:HIT domain-containing protein [Deltaproteobacteria bacterium]
LTLYTGDEVLVVMNKYPYINRHLLVAPKQHVGSLSDLSQEMMGMLTKMVDLSIGVLKEKMSPDGFNVGLNLGRVAGAGVEEHLHFHVVPRWFGDVNALAVFADVRVIPEHIQATCDNLKPLFAKLPRSLKPRGQ